ncbi:MAG: flagellar basal body-associated FliL family protein [Gammaproteobacteria bacterium]|nr:flagellar basal body-associated FliL family protein [Gammaproteobacteria bacterium]
MKYIFALFFMIIALPAITAEEANPEEPKAEVHYFDLDPNIITNYQKPPSRRLGFVTVDVQLQVSSVASLDDLEYHKPLVESTIIDVINELDEKTIKDISKRNEIRAKVKMRVANALKEETGKEIVDDVLFTSFIYQ